MPNILFSCAGGALVLPDHVLCDRRDGGHLIVNPPRPVWERGELSWRELAHWSLLVAVTGDAMLRTLACLRDGCLNYWEAGNWALNDQAEPVGPKRVRDQRRVHLHVFGRSRHASHPDWRWGESPRFPDYAARAAWSAPMQALTADECQAVVRSVAALWARQSALPLPSKVAA